MLEYYMPIAMPEYYIWCFGIIIGCAGIGVWNL